MPNIGPLEIVIVLIIVLIVFGPKRLPEMGRSLGQGMREFKNSITGNDEDDEPREIERAKRESRPPQRRRRAGSSERMTKRPAARGRSRPRPQALKPVGR